MKKTIIITLILCMVLPVILSACTPSHEHEYSTEITKQPTCSATGIKTYTCTICKDSYTEEIPTTEHTLTEEVTLKPTCEKEGVITKTCVDCGYSEKEAIPMAEHEYKEKITKKATCTKKGTKTLTCSVCGDTKKEEIPAKGHNFNEKITQKATCTKAGKKTLTCKNCGLKKTEKIPAKGHQWINATCTTAKKCSVCGKKDGKALGHIPNDDGRCTRCGQEVGLITIKLKGKALPRTLTCSDWGTITTKTLITGFDYKVEMDEYDNGHFYHKITLYFTGEKLYDREGSGYSRECTIGYKLYDSDGYMIASGNASTADIKEGEKFRDWPGSEFYTEVKLIRGGTYTLELLDVR